jgi:hypothetical protein
MLDPVLGGKSTLTAQWEDLVSPPLRLLDAEETSKRPGLDPSQADHTDWLPGLVHVS